MTKLENDISKYKKLIVAGDSWTYGSEIRPANLPLEVNDWDPKNDEYRIPRIWPSKLANLLGIEEVKNLSYPAASNDSIVRYTIGYLTQEYFSKGKSADDVLVVIGFTSPERKDFYYRSIDNPHKNFWYTLWPMWKHKYPQAELTEFAELYMAYMYNSEEYIHRYLNQIFYLQTVLEKYNIDYLFFQAFYQRSDMHIKQWADDPFHRHYQGQPDEMLWNLINDVRFMHKNEKIHSFHNYIINRDQTPTNSQAILNMHPSELGHTWWAEHIYEYGKEKNLW